MTVEEPADRWRREAEERRLHATERESQLVADLLTNNDLVQRTRNLSVYVPHREEAAQRLGVPPAFVDAVLGAPPATDARGPLGRAGGGVKTGVALEAARLARIRATPREPTPLEKERARLESVRKERQRAKERPFARARKSGVNVYRPAARREVEP